MRQPFTTEGTAGHEGLLNDVEALWYNFMLSSPTDKGNEDFYTDYRTAEDRLSQAVKMLTGDRKIVAQVYLQEVRQHYLQLTTPEVRQYYLQFTSEV